MTCAKSRFRSVVALATVWLGLANGIWAALPEVRDEASFFSPGAVSRANADIQEIKRLFKKDLQVETFPTPPANLKDSFQKNQGKAFADWAASQAAKGKIDGIYVLICKAPAHLEIVIDNASLKKAFLSKDRDTLRDALLGRFREKAFDKGLAETTALVRERLEQNLGSALPASPLNVVQDRASFFSPQLVSRINLEVKEFHQRFKKDLVIETFTTPPADRQKLLADANPAEKSKILASWLHERAKDSKADGIAVLICREPPRIQVEVSTAMSQKAFPTKDRDQLVELLVGRFKAKEFDKALETALDFVYDAVDRNLAAAPAPLALGTITDRAALFSASAMQRASQDIAAFTKNDRQTVTVETFALPPPGQVKRVEAMNADARNAFFAGWLKERMQTVKFEGIYLMICKQPGNVQIGVSDAAQVKMFTPADRAELAKILNGSFQAKQFDEGLFKSLEFIKAAFIRDTFPVRNIQDEAGFFSAVALEKANATIRDLRRRFQKEVLVETFNDVPAERAPGVDLKDAAARAKVFAAWAEERRKSLQVDGITILICKNPMNLQVATSPNGIFADQRDDVAKLLLARFKDKQYDAGLTETLQFIDQTLQKKLSTALAPEAKVPIAKMSEVEPKAVAKEQNATEPVKAGTKKMAAPSAEAVSDRVGFDVMWVVWGFAILGGLWLVIGILRALFGAGKLPPPPPPQEPIAPIQSAPPAPLPGAPPTYGGSPYPQKPYPQPSPYSTQQPYPMPQQAPPGQSGGGVLPSLLGGLFGGVAGGWMYDRVRGSGSAHAGVSYSTGSQPPPPPVSQIPAGQAPFGYKPPPAAADVGYSSSGGDFGAPVPDQTGYASSGGDFAQPDPVQPDYATSGRDFGQPAPVQPDYGSSGGDFAQPTPEQPEETSGGGDFDAPSQDTTSAGGDFAPPPEPPANDWTAPEAGGGDFGGGTPNQG